MDGSKFVLSGKELSSWNIKFSVLILDFNIVQAPEMPTLPVGKVSFVNLLK